MEGAEKNKHLVVEGAQFVIKITCTKTW